MNAQVIQQAFAKLNPGGWLESQEIDVQLYCDDGTAPADHGLRLWLNELDRVSQLAGKPCCITPHLKGWFVEAGFVDVREEVFKVPTCGWPEDPVQREIGTWCEEMLSSGIDGIARAYQLRVAGLTMEQHQVSEGLSYLSLFFFLLLTFSFPFESLLSRVVVRCAVVSNRCLTPLFIL